MDRKLVFLLCCLFCLFLIGGCDGDAAGLPPVASEGTGEGEASSVLQGKESAVSFLSGRFVDPISEWDSYDRLIDSICREQDSSAYIGLVREAEDMLMKTGCIVPIYEMQAVCLAKDCVSDLFVDPYSIDHYADITMDNSAGIVRIGITHTPVLDPAYALSEEDISLIGNCFTGLYAYDRSGEIVSACADHYELSDDGSTYTIYLKEGLKWAGGADLTPADFVYSWKRTASSNKRYGYLFSFIDGYPDDLSVRVVSDSAFSVKVSRPCDHFKQILAFPLFAPARQDIIDANPDKWYQIGGNAFNGAYTCMFSDPVRTIALIPNQNWVLAAADGPAGLNIQFDLFNNDISAYSAYKAGDLDILKSVPINVLFDYSAAGSGEYRTFPILGTTILAMNARSPVFSRMSTEESVCFRLAVSALIDKTFITSETAPDSRSEADSIIPVDMSGGRGEIYLASGADAPEGNGSSMEKAVRLLSLAGFSFDKQKPVDADRMPVLQCLYPESSVCRETIEAVSQDLAAAGIRLILDPADSVSFHRKARSGAYDIVLDQRIAAYDDPLCLLAEWVSGSPGNYCLFGDS
ncbi:MAG: hypothetical protein IK088_07825 [Lachnospiraceae bacterium]|nr:hypothetical protein [Lachnospiraceae bacterium]